ncbi:MAG: BrnT family toxin [Nitrospirae bacterium]|nr:BrnT family toxin [Magnetococcales bacterium]HAT49465.1 hypothetical protein [Alphaproteobacteria bacterium]
MNIEFDIAKDIANQGKHGESLNAARDIDWGSAIVSQDRRHNYGEIRQVGFAPIGNRVFCVVFVDRGDIRRIISLRKANKREIRDYVNARKLYGFYPSHS